MCLQALHLQLHLLQLQCQHLHHLPCFHLLPLLLHCPATKLLQPHCELKNTSTLQLYQVLQLLPPSGQTTTWVLNHQTLPQLPTQALCPLPHHCLSMSKALAIPMRRQAAGPGLLPNARALGTRGSSSTTSPLLTQLWVTLWSIRLSFLPLQSARLVRPDSRAGLLQ